MQQYLDLMAKTVKEGRYREGRNGGTYGIFGHQMRFNLADGFPLVTTKKTHLRSIIHEMLWFMRGCTDNRELTKEGVTIWNEWAATKEMVEVGENVNWVAAQQNATITCPPGFDEMSWTDILDWFTKAGLDVNDYMYIQEGEIGPMYGKQMRSWPTAFGSIDQIKTILATLKKDPMSRRMCVSTWNPESLPWEDHSVEENVMEGRMALAPCHAFFQFYADELTTHERLAYVDRHYLTSYVLTHEARFINELEEANVPKYRLSCQLYMRSNDVPLGCPFNIAGYALLIHMFAHILNMIPGELVYTIGDAHIYANQMELTKTQLSRTPMKLPKLRIDTKGRDVTDPAFFQFDDFILEGYESHPHIAYPVSK